MKRFHFPCLTSLQSDNQPINDATYNKNYELALKKVLGNEGLSNKQKSVAIPELTQAFESG